MLTIDLSYEWLSFQAHYQASFSSGMTTIIGASGEGKSTLLQLIGGFLPARGIIHYNGQDLHHLQPFQRPITTLFQSDNVLPQLNVWQNVAIGLQPSLKLTPTEAALIQWALEQTQLTAFAKKRPDELSGGQLQRTALARALVRKKPILLLDEPFSALDPALRREMLALVSDLTQDQHFITLLVSHDPLEALRTGGNIVLIEKGKVVLTGPVSLLKPPAYDAALMRYLGDSSVS